MADVALTDRSRCSAAVSCSSTSLTWATSWLGPENVRRTKVRWKGQAWPGDVLECGGTIARTYEENGERRVDLDLVCRRRGDGQTVVEGWMTFVVP